jgi:polysaccharide deacetylase family protein (PEP-CTERM system associated)
LIPAEPHSPGTILLTFDVEEWFQVENFKPWIAADTWPDRESRVVDSTERILGLLDRCSEARAAMGGGPDNERIRATFFVLGWVAERHPELVREIHRRGHEIAAHGYAHELTGNQDRATLSEDVHHCKDLLENLAGEPVNGYRAPSFSVTPTLLDVLAELGFKYDSSYNSFSLNPRYGHLDVPPPRPKGIATLLPNGLWELPISNCRLAGQTVPLGGGGYFRLFPLPFWKIGVRRILQAQKAYLMYLHPWEFDPDQPRVSQAFSLSKFRHYHNLHLTEINLERLIFHFSESSFVTCSTYIAAQTEKKRNEYSRPEL